MLWHRQAIFKLKGDKLCYSAECRIIPDTKSPADWMLADKPTELSRIKLKNLNSTACPYVQRAFSPLDPTVSWLSHLALAIYIFVVVNFDALAQASDIQIERRQVVFLCWIQDLNPGSQTPNRQQTECSLTKDKPVMRPSYLYDAVFKISAGLNTETIKNEVRPAKSHLNWSECQNLSKTLYHHDKQYIEVQQDFHWYTNICEITGLNAQQNNTKIPIFKTGNGISILVSWHLYIETSQNRKLYESINTMNFGFALESIEWIVITWCPAYPSVHGFPLKHWGLCQHFACAIFKCNFVM